MHKRKDGKIVASLTEVKNKTGDIFALVDEFGEVTLTSYNKPKYRISKVDILETLNLQEEKQKPAKKEPKVVAKSVEKKSVMHKVKERFIRPATTTPVEVSSEGFGYSFSEGMSSVSAWSRGSRNEMSFISKIKKPLQ